MDAKVMELRTRQWLSLFEEQTKSGLNKKEWCAVNGINRGAFFRWQRRVRAYLLAQGESAGQLQAPGINERQTDNDCFVELPCPQPAVPESVTMKNLHDDVMKEASPISIHYGGFSIHVDGRVDETQLTAVLRAMKNAD